MIRKIKTEVLSLLIGSLLAVAGCNTHSVIPITFSLDVKGLDEATKEHRNPGCVVLKAGESLELRLSAINSHDTATQLTKVTARVIILSGEEVWSKTLHRSFPPGETHLTYQLFDQPAAPQEGMFLAQVISPYNGQELTNLIFGYFPAVPDIAEEPNAPILILRNRKVVGQISADRSWPKLPDYTRLDPILTQASDGILYAMFQENHYAEEGDTRAQKPTFAWSTDAGKNWKMRRITLDPPAGNVVAVRSFGIAGSDQLFLAYSPLPKIEPEELVRQIKQRMKPVELEMNTLTRLEYEAGNTNPLALFVSQSTDRGQNWSQGVEVNTSQYARVQGLGRFYSGAENSILFNCTLIGPEKHDRARVYDGVFRSKDGGKTWGDVVTVMSGSAECQFLQLASGKWLTTIRSVNRPGDRLSPEGRLVNIFGLDKLATYEKKSTQWPQGYVMHKRTFIAHSQHGRSWTNLRQLTTIVGDTPGELIQLPDGRVVFIYCHRYKPQDGVYARVSHDEGRTWQPELLALRIGGGYPSSTVLKDGTIVSMVSHETVQVIRWRLPEDL